MDKRDIYIVRKCTTDQLGKELNDLNYEALTEAGTGEVMQITHTGGRDWVVIHRVDGTIDDLYRLSGSSNLLQVQVSGDVTNVRVGGRSRTRGQS